MFKMKKQLIADLGLLFVTIGWGASFILTKVALASLATYNFLAIRFILAFIISSLIFSKRMLNLDRRTVKYGLTLGVILFLHYGLQTVGLNYTTPSKSAFITGINVILVPLFSTLLLKQLPEKRVIFSTILAFIGLGLLTLNHTSLQVNIGDIYTFLCAFVFASYIILVGRFTGQSESIGLAVLQLGVVGGLSLLTSFIIESPTLPTKPGVWLTIGTLSVVCTSGAYIIQSLAQRYTTPTHTALIYTAEPVFAAGFGFLIYGSILSRQGLLGAVLILSGMLLTEVDFTKAWTKYKELTD